ncbi:type IV pilus modification PilV family protein [Desulfobulbus elongatus]|uniref:type IV pilus modification PilV family protein n=1 Tax=Desulfobulbus elongatus TaxID=53332 RepID=UPI0009FF3894|nr:prepilin-type N-terminal cleavage/methylation domain-containing protein [Desulfobulbus elongatus]
MSFPRRKPCFNRPLAARGRCASGFTLLEVMIAVALIAIALVTLIGAQAHSVAIATGARFDAVASMLAQWKLTELSLEDFGQLTGSSGDFGDAYPHFSWKSEVEEVGESESGIKGSGDMLKTVDVTVLVDGDPTRTYTARTIVYKNQKNKTDTDREAETAGSGKAEAGGNRETGAETAR